MGSAENTPIEKLLGLLYRHRQILEEIYNHREVYYSPEDPKTLAQVNNLRHHRILHGNPDRYGGINARLASNIRDLLNITTRHRRLQEIGVDITALMKRVTTLVGKWQEAADSGEMDEAADAADEITELLEGTELRYDEQLTGLQERIGGTYGYTDSSTQRIREFTLYMDELKTMADGAIELQNQLRGEDFDGVDPIRAISLKLSERFRHHGSIIVKLQTDLESHILSARRRQAQTRRWIRTQRWLKRQERPLSFPNAQANASQLMLLRRATGLRISGNPDLSNPILSPRWETMNADLAKRRNLSLSRKAIQREESGQRQDDPKEIDDAARLAEHERERAWDAARWINDYLRQAVRCAALTPDSQGVSAVAFWRERTIRDSDRAKPSLRAWLNELGQLITSNRPVAGTPFFGAFEFSTHPTIEDRLMRERIVVTDVYVRARASAVRNHRSARQVA